MASQKISMEPESKALKFLLAVLVPMCARGFLRQVTALTTASKKLAEAAPMGTARQIYEASRGGHEAVLTTYLAYWKGNRERYEVLNWMSSDGAASLHAAVRWNQLACVKLLVAAVPDVAICFVNKFDGAPLHIACDKCFVPIVRILLASGVSLSPRDMSQNTPLHLAAKRGNSEIVQMLTDMKVTGKDDGLELEAQNDKGKTALDLARDGNHDDVVAIIEKKKALNANGLEVFRSAFYGDMVELGRLTEKWEGNEEVLNWFPSTPYAELEDEFMLESSWLYGATPILVASHNGHLAAVQLLCGCAGVNPFHLSDMKFNILMWAVLSSRNDNAGAICRYLLSALPSIDVNYKSENCGETALSLAVEQQNTECVRTLINVEGIDLKVIIELLSTAIHDGSVEIVRILCATPGIGININKYISIPYGRRQERKWVEGTVLDQVAIQQEGYGNEMEDLAEIADLLRAAGAKTAAQLEGLKGEEGRGPGGINNEEN